MGRFSDCLRLLVLLWTLLHGAVWAAVDVTQAPRVSLDQTLHWCATDRTLGLEQVQGGACQLGPVAAGDTSQGLDPRAFWLQATLVNPGEQVLERWISVGHPRLQDLSLFWQGDDGRWQRRDAGIRTPLVRRDEVGRWYGALRLELPAKARTTVWLRVASDTAIDLSTTVWEPQAFRSVFYRQQFSLTLALGALFIVMVLALMAYAVARAPNYLFFALSMAGEFLIESFRSGALQRHLFPEAWPMPVETAAFGALLAVAGFTAYFRVFIPRSQRGGRLYRVFLGLTAITLLAQGCSIAIDYRLGVRVWPYTINALILLGIVLALRSWRAGMRSAGTFVFSFALVACLEVLRLGAVVGGFPFLWIEVMAGPWALVMTTPLVLLSLFQRNQELHDKVLRLEVENTSRLHFLAQMSHELRAPLNTILGNTQLLRRDALPRQQEFLQAIELSGRHFLRMIEDLLDHARGAIGRLHLAPEPLDWPSFLRELGQIGRSLAQQQANAFVLETRGPHPAAVVADGQRLRQVLENLLVNAARHTRNGLIRVECTATAAESGLCRLEFAVVDTGEGIATADLERVFLPFERGRDAHRSGKGAGMGLTIARQLTEAMGGTVQALSSPGAGSTFRVSLQVPLAAGVLPEAAPLLADLPTAYVGAQRHLLLAEDEPEAVAVLNTLLTSLGFAVRCVGCGNAAVQALDQEHFDLVLVDQHMPEGDGWLVLEQCRRRHAGLAVFLLSSSPPIRPPHCAPGLVFDAHFLKPLDHRALLDRIGNVLDLQWVTAPIPVVEAKPPHPDTRPDAATLARLRALLDLGQVSEIMALALELKGQPMLCDYANRLYQASTNLDFVELARLCSAPDA